MSSLLASLNSKQKLAVSHTNGPLLIIAGAGTGKTTVITKHIANLLEQKLALPHEILALTFTDKASGEMSGRVEEYLPLGNYDLWISTFHSFCERILQQHGIDIGLPNDFELLDKTRQWILVHNNFAQFNLDYYKPIGSPNKFIDALLDHFSKCKDELITPESYLAFANKFGISSSKQKHLPTQDQFVDIDTEVARLKEVAQAFKTYQELLLNNNCLDFADLIQYTIQLFEKRPNILQHYQNQFKYIMVDEFQDTNIAQYELIKLLSKKTHNLVVVGDDDQSIYKFRGASVSNILKLKQDFPEITEISLTDNYRNTQEILDLSYNFIQANNPNRLEAQLNIDKRLVAHNQSKGLIQVLEGQSLSEELDLVIKEIHNLKSANPKASWNDFAILTRTNSGASEITPLLEKKGIPFTFVANKGLYQKKLIAGIINYLKLLDNYHESEALYQVLNFPKFQLPPEDISLITNFAHKKTISLFEALCLQEQIKGLTTTTQQKITTLLNLLNTHSQQTREKFAIEAFVQILTDLGISQYLEQDTHSNVQDRHYLDQFYKIIENYSQTNEDRTMRGYLAHLKLELQAGEEGSLKFDPDSGPESLTVSTVHNSKGLEFQYVFVINMVDQRFPTREKRDAIEIPKELIKDILPEGNAHLQEERRLFYVAITRAKTHLYLSWGRDYGGAKLKKPSSFLEEAKLVPSEKIKLATGKVVFDVPQKPITTRKIKTFIELPSSFSFSQINEFLTCPLEYQYRYIKKIPSAGNHHLSFGSTIHAVLQKYMEEYLHSGKERLKLPPKKRLLELYEQQWIDFWYQTQEQKQQYKARGEVILNSFYDTTKRDHPIPVFLEQPFTLKLQGEEEYLFKGKIDRADDSPVMRQTSHNLKTKVTKTSNKNNQPDDTKHILDIIDYKTGEKIPAKSSSSDVDQLLIYQWACQDYFHQSVHSLKYWYVYPNQFKEVPLATPDQIEQLKQKLVSTIEKIRETIRHNSFEELHKTVKQHNCKREKPLQHLI